VLWSVVWTRRTDAWAANVPDILRLLRVVYPVLRLLGQHKLATIISLAVGVGWLVVSGAAERLAGVALPLSVVGLGVGG